MGCETLPLTLLCCYGDGGPPGVGLLGDEQLCENQEGRGLIKDRDGPGNCKQRDRRWSDI